MSETKISQGLLWTWLSLLPRGRQIKAVLAQNPQRLERLWNRNREELQILKTTSAKFYEGVINMELRDMAQQAFQVVRKRGMGIVTLTDDSYPALLKKAPDAPAVLFYHGDISLCHDCISVVGSRKATAYGLRVAEQLAAELAQSNVCVVSGMARGIDSRAHWGALNAEGVTCAVVGCGLDMAYPPENKKLMEQIMEKGVVLSEYAPGTMPLPQHFPARNRIISGLSQGLVVVEAGRRSGTLITVDFALEQGRDVFAIPGNIYSERSEGTNRLIQDGAKVVLRAKDILQEYGWENRRADTPESRQRVYGLRGMILEALEAGTFQIDDILKKSQYTVQEINGELMMMQLEGVLEKRVTGEYFIKRKRK